MEKVYAISQSGEIVNFQRYLNIRCFPNWPLTVGNLLIIFSSLNENVTLSLTLSGDVLPVIHTAGNNNNNNSYTQWSLD